MSAIVLGDFSGLDNEEYFNYYFEQLSQTLNIPIVSGLKFGHEQEKLTFPIGVPAKLNTELNTISIN